MFTLYDTGPGTILDEKPGNFAPGAARDPEGIAYKTFRKEMQPLQG
jgi:hypothetical protein